MKGDVSLNNKKERCDCQSVHLDIKQIREEMPGRPKLTLLADLYKVFSDPTRIQILWALGKEEMCVCDLAILLNMSLSAISHQLKVLRLAKLASYRRDGKNIYYALADDHVKDILQLGFGHISEHEKK